jgi:hypothetical protein
MGPGSLPWLLLPFRGDTAGRTPIQTERLRHPRHKMMNIGRIRPVRGRNLLCRYQSRGRRPSGASRTMLLRFVKELPFPGVIVGQACGRTRLEGSAGGLNSLSRRDASTGWIPPSVLGIRAGLVHVAGRDLVRTCYATCNGRLTTGGYRSDPMQRCQRGRRRCGRKRLRLSTIGRRVGGHGHLLDWHAMAVTMSNHSIKVRLLRNCRPGP